MEKPPFAGPATRLFNPACNAPRGEVRNDRRVSDVADLLAHLGDELVAFGERNDAGDIVASGELLRGMAMLHLRDPEKAKHSFHRAMTLFEHLGDGEPAARAMTNLAAMILDVEEGSPKWWRLHEEAVRVINKRLRHFQS
jgi:hypothetical protein